MTISFEHTALKPPTEDWRGPVVLSPDGSHIAFRRERLPHEHDVWLASIANPADARAIHHGTKAASAFDLAFSPDGSSIALLLSDGAGQRQVCTVACVLGSATPLPVARRANVFVWAAGTLVLFDSHGGALLEIPASGSERVIAKLEDEGSRMVPPILTADAAGLRFGLALHRMAVDRTPVWIVERGNAAPRLFTSVNGFEARVNPIWSKDGRDLALQIVQPAHQRSAIIIHYDAQGGGEIAYTQELLDATDMPAWSATGRHVAFFRTPPAPSGAWKSGPAALTLLDVETRKLETLTAPGQIVGRCRFTDPTNLVVDGHDAAHVFRFASPV